MPRRGLLAVRPRLPFQIGHRPEGPTQVLIVSGLWWTRFR